jgi:hypothetical protein
MAVCCSRRQNGTTCVDNAIVTAALAIGSRVAGRGHQRLTLVV